MYWWFCCLQYRQWLCISHLALWEIGYREVFHLVGLGILRLWYRRCVVFFLWCHWYYCFRYVYFLCQCLLATEYQGEMVE